MRRHHAVKLAMPTILTVLLLLPLAALAQDDDRGPYRRQGPPDMDRVMADLDQQLDLTDDQSAQVRTILEEQRQAMQQLRDEFGRPEDDQAREEMRGRVRAIHHDTQERLSQVLDEEQMQRFQELQRRRRHHRHPGPGGPGGPDAPGGPETR
jgi:Spy/CpxP family protein refolding chaperone